MRRLLLALILATPLLAQERSLYWDRVAVTARIDAAGKLHVREEQTYVFNGDWNGGERVFRVERGQTFEFHRMSRDGVPMKMGSLEEVDNYEFTNEKRLRWRSRLPSDPPFSNQRITYVLEYTLGNILVRRSSETYALDHDFAFPDRSGEIKRMVVDLELDPSWQSSTLLRHYEGGPLPPKRSFVVGGTLEYRGATAPDVPWSMLPVRILLAISVIVVPFLLWRRFVAREQSLGRLAPVAGSNVTSEWIDANLVSIAPEVVGAVWDETVSSSEVSALLARWVAEKKIASAAEGDGLRMTLLAPRESFEGYERELIDKFFFAGDVTSTDAIKEEYKDKGFSPASIITRPLMEKAQALAQMNDPAPPISKWPSFVLFLMAVLLVTIGLRTSKEGQMGTAVMIWVSALLWMIGFFVALQWRGRIDWGLRHTAGFMSCLAIVILSAITLFLADIGTTAAHFGFAAGVWMIANNLLNNAKSKRGAGSIAFRKRLAAARQYFIDQLGMPQPAIDDQWFPYVIAFGLNANATSWSESFGGRSTSGFRDSHSSSSSSSSSPQWTGGGGQFGGAGASGGWTAAAAGLAAGVAGASSSSGGGGGGSSGGGGGGGW